MKFDFMVGSELELIRDYIPTQYKLIKWSNGKRMLLIFDWKVYGNGRIEPYLELLHYLCLKSKEYIVSKINFKGYINSSINLDVKYVCKKGLPRSIKKDMIEGRNYIHNRWYLYEAVCLLHSMYKICPTIHDIACSSLGIFLMMHKGKYSKEIIRKTQESSIRNDILILSHFGMLSRQKIGKSYYYSAISPIFTYKTQTFQIGKKLI